MLAFDDYVMRRRRSHLLSVNRPVSAHTVAQAFVYKAPHPVLAHSPAVVIETSQSSGASVSTPSGSNDFSGLKAKLEQLKSSPPKAPLSEGKKPVPVKTKARKPVKKKNKVVGRPRTLMW